MVHIDEVSNLEVIGQGGFATVYRGRQEELGRLIAVKVLTSSTIDDTALARFQRECLAAGAMSSHPNIVTVLGAGRTPDGYPYLLMEYAQGGSLADKVRESGPFGVGEVVELGVAMAGALSAAHRADIVHRDVKPENILYSEFGQPLLGDFGIARLANAFETRSGVITATLAYAAPEVLAGQPATPRADVYSLAAVLMFAALGRPAFSSSDDESLVPLLARIATEPPPDLRPLGFPGHLCEVLESALAKDPEDRPVSSDAFAAMLTSRGVARASPSERSDDLSTRTVDVGAPTTGADRSGDADGDRPPGPPPRSRPWAIRLAVAGTGLVILALLGTMWALRDGGDGDAGREAVIAAASVPTAEPPTGSATPNAEPTGTATPQPRPEPSPTPETPGNEVAVAPPPPAPTSVEERTETPVPTAEPPSCVRVVADPDDPTLNVREGPGLEFLVTTALGNGTRVSVAETSGDWLRITAPTEGWVFAARTIGDCRCIRTVADPDDPNLNVRAGPGTGFDVLGTLDNGTTIATAEAQGEWLRITAPAAGWVFAARTSLTCT